MITRLPTAPTYAHDADCNTDHTPGPEPCPRPTTRRSWLAWQAVSWIALAVGVIALVVSAIHDSPMTTTVPTVAPPAVPPQVADRALCEAVGPLMKSSLDIDKTRTPDLTALRASIRNWQTHIQPVLDEHSQPPRYLVRTVQRYIDDLVLYVEEPGAAENETVWNMAIAEQKGAAADCVDLGVDWWR